MASKDKSIPTYHLCSIHQTENIQMYCSDCDHASCLKCIAGPHRGHHFDTIEDVVHKKRDEVAKYLTKVEDIISSFTSALDSVKRNHSDYSTKIKALTEMVNSKREEWKKQIDEIADTVLSQMKTMTDKDLGELKERETTLANNVAKFKEILKTCREKERTADDISFVNLIADFKQKEKTQKSCPVLIGIFPPHFVGDRADTSHLREIFGRMVRDDEEAASDFVGSVNQGVKSHIDTTTVATITPEIICTCVSTVGEDKAWVGYRYLDKVIALANKGGQVLQKIDLGFIPGDVTTVGTGELLVTDYNGQQVKKYSKDGQYVNTIMNTSPYWPQGLCTTSDNGILVCLYQSDANNKVIRVTTGQTKQTLEYDKQNKPLFTNPRLVHENINRDVCVVDHNTLVVVNKDGELRFRYPDKSTKSTTVTVNQCWGIVCDGSGNILLSDSGNHHIHLIDINGKFVQYVLDKQHGIVSPWGLSSNSKGELWMCNENGTKVVVIKYRS